MRQNESHRNPGVLRTWLVVLALPIVLLWVTDSMGYERWRDNVDPADPTGPLVGCTDCHGAFTDGTSQKGTVFPSDNKHTMPSECGGPCAALPAVAGDGAMPVCGSGGTHRMAPDGYTGVCGIAGTIDAVP